MALLSIKMHLLHLLETCTGPQNLMESARMITDTVAKQNIDLAQATLGDEMGQPMYGEG